MNPRKALLTVIGAIAALGASYLFTYDAEVFESVRAAVCDSAPEDLNAPAAPVEAP